MRGAAALNSGLQSGLSPKAPEDGQGLLLTTSPTASRLKQEATHTQAASALTPGQRGQPSKRSSWQAALPACVMELSMPQQPELQMSCHLQPVGLYLASADKRVAGREQIKCGVSAGSWERQGSGCALLTLPGAASAPAAWTSPSTPSLFPNSATLTGGKGCGCAQAEANTPAVSVLRPLERLSRAW